MTMVLAFLLLATITADDCGFMRMSAPLGAIVSEGDIVRGPCSVEAVPAKLRYDARRGVAIARYSLREGEALGRVYLPPRPDILPGDSVALVARIGHVMVRREMTALQAARISERFFARDDEGEVMLAPEIVGSGRP